MNIFASNHSSFPHSLTYIEKNPFSLWWNPNFAHIRLGNLLCFSFFIPSLLYFFTFILLLCLQKNKICASEFCLLPLSHYSQTDPLLYPCFLYQKSVLVPMISHFSLLHQISHCSLFILILTITSSTLLQLWSSPKLDQGIYVPKEDKFCVEVIFSLHDQILNISVFFEIQRTMYQHGSS